MSGIGYVDIMKRNIREVTVDGYTLLFRQTELRYELVLKYNSHFAVHTEVQLLDSEGNFLENKNLSPEYFDELVDNITKYGPNDGLYLTKKTVTYVDIPKRIQPSDILHVETKQEKSYTTTGEKLKHHWPIFKKLQDTGMGSIIRATMTLHQVCASHCQYCSTIGRNKKDSISLQEAKDFVEKLYHDQAEYNKKHYPEYNEMYKDLTGSDIRLRGLILSGGGQPNLWPHFTEFVEWLSTMDIDLGLITNGFPKSVNDDVYKHFEWVRLSITPENASPFYPEGKFNLQRIPDLSNTTFGLSYVYGPWTEDEILLRLEQAGRDWNASYVRLLADCNLSRDMHLRSHMSLSDRLLKLQLIKEDGIPSGKIFHQLRYHGTSEEANELWDTGQCYLQSFNTFWDTTGHEDNGVSYCYPCDSVNVLADTNLPERKFNSDKWGTVTNDKVSDLYTVPVKPYFDPRKNCQSCMFMRNNQVAKDLSKNTGNIIVDKSLVHVNFP